MQEQVKIEQQIKPEEQLSPLPAAETRAACELLWAPGGRAAAHALYAAACQDVGPRVVVLDDDPTGVQTVHDVPVVTDWQESTFRDLLSGEDRLFFVLTNSRSFSVEETTRVHAEIARNLRAAAEATRRDIQLISRGDSTLRGHYPLETQVLRDHLGQPLAGEVFCPFFREGGRFTLDGVHYVQQGEFWFPAAATEFARDSTFGYAHSFLPDYLEEKSGGSVTADQVLQLSLADLRSLDLSAMESRLLASEGYRYIVADALEEADVQVLFVLLSRLWRRGRRYLIRSAAAVPKVFGQVTDRPLLSRAEMTSGPESVGGLVIVGSHVRKTTEQLECLLHSSCPVSPLEFHVDGWCRPGGLQAETERVAALAEQIMCQGRTPVVFTSRDLVSPPGASPEDLLRVSVEISSALTAVVSSLSVRPRFLIAKGGITSSDVGTRALRVRRALVLGQAAPGIPVWRTGPESRFPGMSYIIFPGNVGGVDTLRQIVSTLTEDTQ